jgi:hypothetical protein
VILGRTNPNRAAAARYARKILSIDLPLATWSTNLSRQRKQLRGLADAPLSHERIVDV